MRKSKEKGLRYAGRNREGPSGEGDGVETPVNSCSVGQRMRVRGRLWRDKV
jgi:hypothetical protein